MTVRLAPVTDVGTLMRWRAEVLEAVFGAVPDKALLEANRRYYSEAVSSGRHLAFIARTEEGEEGCGAVCFSEELPSPDNPSGLCAYLMNVYVRPDCRGRGIAHALVRHLVDCARRRGCGKIYLETTPMARPLYASTGFSEMPDMMKYEHRD